MKDDADVTDASSAGYEACTQKVLIVDDTGVVHPCQQMVPMAIASMRDCDACKQEVLAEDDTGVNGASIPEYAAKEVAVVDDSLSNTGASIILNKIPVYFNLYDATEDVPVVTPCGYMAWLDRE